MGELLNNDFMGERGVFRGEMLLHIGLFAKDHDCLQSVLWSFVRGARLQQAVIS
jgi:hypothetical protein